MSTKLGKYLLNSNQNYNKRKLKIFFCQKNTNYLHLETKKNINEWCVVQGMLN